MKQYPDLTLSGCWLCSRDHTTCLEFYLLLIQGEYLILLMFLWQARSSDYMEATPAWWNENPTKQAFWPSCCWESFYGLQKRGNFWDWWEHEKGHCPGEDWLPSCSSPAASTQVLSVESSQGAAPWDRSAVAQLSLVLSGTGQVSTIQGRWAESHMAPSSALCSILAILMITLILWALSAPIPSPQLI